MIYLSRLFFFTVLCAFVALPQSTYAQETSIPELPEPLSRLQADGAQVRYLGMVNGLDGWVTIRQGQEQYFYVTPDKKNFVMGLLFADDGRLLTLDQVQSLRTQEGQVLDELALGNLQRPRLDANTRPNEQFKIQAPSEQLYSDLEASNWVALGDPNAPYIYAVIDPQCPHCHQFLKDLKDDYILNGRLQVRLVPIGIREETRAQAAFLLAAPDPQDVWFRHLAGDPNALPATSNLNQQGVQHNLSVVETWKMDVTPFTVYRGSGGVIKIIRGRAQSPEIIMNDVAG